MRRICVRTEPEMVEIGHGPGGCPLEFSRGRQKKCYFIQWLKASGTSFVTDFVQSENRVKAQNFMLRMAFWT